MTLTRRPFVQLKPRDLFESLLLEDNAFTIRKSKHSRMRGSYVRFQARNYCFEDEALEREHLGL